MAESHLQVNIDGSVESRQTVLWPGSIHDRETIIKGLFEQNNWKVLNINHVGGSEWDLICQSCNKDEYKIKLYISSIRDERRKDDEFKMQLGSVYYPKGNVADGWIELVLGIYVISDRQQSYLLAGYDISAYDFSSNPSIRGTRTNGLQKAYLYGMYSTEKSVIFRPEFLYYYIDSVVGKTHNKVGASNSSLLKQPGQDLPNSVLTYLAAIRTKPFMLLAGISGSGKSRIVRRLAQATTTSALEQKYNPSFKEGSFDDVSNRWKLHKPANFELIQVKPNWHNSMDVVGYQTNIPTPHYVFTPFVEFVAKAWQNPDIPFFLCLDEMNLAPVEEYFAEFLSAIESRSKDGSFETDPIIKPFKDFDYTDEDGNRVFLSADMIDHLLPGVSASTATSDLLEIRDRFRDKGLTLPENLIVIGTVNMDETTFSFSRKVLDRAMSFEMNEVNYDDFLKGESDIIDSALSEEQSNALIDRKINALEVKNDIDSETVISYLTAVNSVLNNTPFKLGYRAANEAILYVAACQTFGQDDIYAALDEFTQMKILSRIEGDSSKLKASSDKTILDLLEDVIKNQLSPVSDSTEDQDEVAGAKQLKSIGKLEYMQIQLKRDGFVSYWN